MTAYDDHLNPFRKITVISLNSDVVWNIVISIATEWMYFYGCMSLELRLERRIVAIKSLREAILSSSVPSPESSSAMCLGLNQDCIRKKHTVLTAVLLQVTNSFFEGWFGSEKRLSCAIELLRDLDLVFHPPTDFLSRFLVQRFAMLDIANALLRHRRVYLPISCWLFKPETRADNVEPYHQQMTGCPRRIVGFLARVCALADGLNAGWDREYISEAAATLSRELYDCPGYGLNPQAKAVSDKNFDALGQCWYWCTHLSLQRRVLNSPPHSSEVMRIVSTLIELMKSIPLGCRPASKIFVPFCMVASEAVLPADREWIKRRNEEMRTTYPSQIREETMAIIEERWGHCDAAQAVDLNPAQIT
jgi:hypothetical protein